MSGRPLRNRVLISLGGLVLFGAVSSMLFAGFVKENQGLSSFFGNAILSVWAISSYVIILLFGPLISIFISILLPEGKSPDALVPQILLWVFLWGGILGVTFSEKTESRSRGEKIRAISITSIVLAITLHIILTIKGGFAFMK